MYVSSETLIPAAGVAEVARLGDAGFVHLSGKVAKGKIARNQFRNRRVAGRNGIIGRRHGTLIIEERDRFVEVFRRIHSLLKMTLFSYSASPMKVMPSMPVCHGG